MSVNEELLKSVLVDIVNNALVGPRHKCDRRIGAVCVYLCRECAYHTQDREIECPNFWKIVESEVIP